MSQLSKEVLEMIEQDEKLIFAIAQGMNKAFRSVERWIKNSRKYSKILTSKAVVLIIEKETGLTEDQIVEETVPA